MGTMINFGIDLGTTNSVIAKFERGEVKVFRDPVSWKDTLPSVVAYRSERVIVGTKAKERMEKDPRNVVGVFKRKMGTSESYPIKSLGENKTPIELSAQVLRHLKSFVEGEDVDEAVVTIPASFDTIQSNATKEAGKQGGFSQVVLLQEPIAASLSYANETKDTDLNNSQWMVYDLGGGTFDVALVRIQDGEMRVLDHEGDNFLGGADFDQMIVEKIIIPHLEKKGRFANLEQEMKSAGGKYNAQYYVCLHKAEQAKIELSAQPVAEIEVMMEDDRGREIDTIITLKREEFEALIRPAVDSTVNMVKSILKRNSLSPLDIRFVLMIGGSTYIPYVRKTVGADLQIETNCDIDPTTAVAMGAAYYAGTKPKTAKKSTIDLTKKKHFKIKMAYQKVSKEDEEFFAARFEGEIDGHTYRITRDDSGFDTGNKPLKTQIHEELPLVENAYNFFRLVIYDRDGNQVATDAEPIGIAHGIYGVEGQPLPNDISIEVDDLENEGQTKLEMIFAKNNVLPLKKTITKRLNKSISKGSTDSLRINILEGPHTVLPEANLSIGYMEISGTDLHRDITKGSDIEVS
ncbi:MAG: Hsp70 family protein, partial [Bacteroidota bacterium]